MKDCIESKRNMKESLYDKLLALKESDEYPFHMPGHKRQMDGSIFDSIMGIDITEIPGFDNLHHPQDIIQDELEYAASFYHTKETFFLVNGSSCGVLTSICATTEFGKDIILARNSHKSAYNAVYLQHLNAHYVYPAKKEDKLPFGPVMANDIEKKLLETNAKVVFLTSPSYEGILSDIKKIAQVVHRHDGILIVDEAHGAHFMFDKRFPESAILSGADIVIQSLHKTMPTLTQTALLHVCSDRIDIDRVRQYLSIYQTSSPSYIFMASISKCLHELSDIRKEKMDSYFELLHHFSMESKALEKIRVLDFKWVSDTYNTQMDPSKLVLFVTHVSDLSGNPYGGRQLADELLNVYHLQVELVSENYVLTMTSVSDTKEGFDRLINALKEIDLRLVKESKKTDSDYQEKDTKIDDNNESIQKVEQIQNPKQVISIFDAMNLETESVLWEESVHKISAEYLYVYPPGSPVLAPGEIITEEIYNQIERYKRQGLAVEGLKDYSLQSILTVKG